MKMLTLRSRFSLSSLKLSQYFCFVAILEIKVRSSKVPQSVAFDERTFDEF